MNNAHAADNNKFGRRDGVVLGFANIAKGTTLVDIGAFNLTPKSKVQLGMINLTDETEGFQLVLLNIPRNGFFPFFNFPKR